MRYRVALLALFLVFLSLRLYRITAPLCDHGAGRQIPTADIAFNYFRGDMHILYPKLSGFGPDPVFIESEFHILPFLTAVLYRAFSVREVFGRLLAVVFSSGAFFLLYALAADFMSRKGAYLSVFFFTFAPFSIYFSRVFMPEPVMLCFSLAALLTFKQWLSSGKTSMFILAILSAALAYLSKIPTLYLLFPIGYLALSRRGKSRKFYQMLCIYLLLSLAPAVAYYYNGYRLGRQFASFGIWDPAYGAFSKWLDLKTILSPEFYLVLFQRISTVIVTPVGMVLSVAGLVLLFKKREARFVCVWLFAILLYIIVLARGNLANDYYQVPLIPPLCLLMAGPFIIWRWKGERFLWLLLPVFVIFSFYYLQPLYRQDAWALRAGEAARDLTPHGALVVANTPMVLYYARRDGWKVHYASAERLEEYIDRGASYLITTKTWPLRNNTDYLTYLTENFGLVSQTSEYLLFDLRRKEPPISLSRLMAGWRLTSGRPLEAQMPIKTEKPIFELNTAGAGDGVQPVLLECLLDGKKVSECAVPGKSLTRHSWKTSTRAGMHLVGVRMARPEDYKKRPPVILSLSVVKVKDRK